MPKLLSKRFPKIEQKANNESKPSININKIKDKKKAPDFRKSMRAF